MTEDFQERRQSKDDYFSGSKGLGDEIDPKTGAKVIKVFSGDYYVTDQANEMMVTVLGSCISACIRDPIARVGGMNHFLLPDTTNIVDAPMRYGAYSMEALINSLLKLGARKSRLEVKVFGGGNVIDSSAMIGDKNVAFIRGYLAMENLPIAQHDLGGESPRRIHYYPDTGKVMMRKLQRQEDYENVEKEEKTYINKISNKSTKGDEGDIELF